MDSVPLYGWILTLATIVVEQGMLVESLLQGGESGSVSVDHCCGATQAPPRARLRAAIADPTECLQKSSLSKIWTQTSEPKKAICEDARRR